MGSRRKARTTRSRLCVRPSRLAELWCPLDETDRQFLESEAHQQAERRWTGEHQATFLLHQATLLLHQATFLLHQATF